MTDVVVWGTESCVETRRLRRVLRRWVVPHQFRDVRLDERARERHLAITHGSAVTPVLTVDRQILVAPTTETLVTALVGAGLVSPSDLEAREHAQNVGDLERVIRGSAAVVMWAASRGLPQPARAVSTAVALGLALTAAVGWCPALDARSLTSLGGPADRPAEARRSRWLTTHPQKHYV